MTKLGNVSGDNATAVVQAWMRQFYIFDDNDKWITPDVSQVRPWAIDALQQWRGEQRLKCGISVAIGQEMAYIDKASHCRDWLKDQSMPFGLALEAAARGLSNLQMAQLVVGQNNAWRAANDQIDAPYAAARAAIEAAATVGEIEATLVALMQ
jgi:hypothetical protein